MPAPPPRQLAPDVREFLEAARFATIATNDEAGPPHLAVVWYLIHDGVVTVNSAPHRRWPSNLRRDPRISMMVEDGARYVALYGTVEPDDHPERAQADIAAMARRYHPDEPDHVQRMVRDQFRRQERVSFRFMPERVHAILEGED